MPNGFNHSFQFTRYEIKEFTREELMKAYFWFPKTREEVVARLGERLEIKDSLPQAALVWRGEDGDPDTDPMIIVDGCHRVTLFLATKEEPEALKAVLFHVGKEDYDYYKELVHSNYLSCIFRETKLEDLREQHLKKCMGMFSKK